MIEEKEMYYCSVSQTLKESNSSVKVGRQNNKELSLTPIYSKRLIEGNHHIILSDKKSMPFPVSEKKDTNKRLKTVLTCDYNSILSSLRKFSEDKIEGRIIKRKGTECLEREEISSLTNTERISYFYQYTEESMRIISEMKMENNKKLKLLNYLRVIKNWRYLI